MESELQPGTRIAGRYVIKRLLGKGGMGAVYEAQHEELGRLVALKVLLPKFAQDGDVVQRFFREARSAAAIRHPGIVEVFDLGRDGDMAFIVMEKLDGEELTDRIRYTVHLGQRFVTEVGLDVADAMAAAHAQGVIHRDLKPQNIFLAKQGRGREVVKILDFGIAKLVDSEMGAAQPLTRTGEFVGTPLYMAPEQLRGLKDLDARADVYAMGVILYEALSGELPFQASSLPDLVLKAVTEDPRPLAGLRPSLSPALIGIVAKAMARDRDARFASAAELRDALAAVAPTLPADEPEQAREARDNLTSDTTPSGSHDTAPSGPRLAASAPKSVAPVAVLAEPPALKKSRWPLFAVGGAVLIAVAGVAYSSRAPEPMVTPEPLVPPQKLVVPEPVVIDAGVAEVIVVDAGAPQVVDAGVAPEPQKKKKKTNTTKTNEPELVPR